MRPAALLGLVGLLLAGRAAAMEPLDGPTLQAHLESLADILAMRTGGALPVLDEADYQRLAAGATVMRQQEIEDSETLGATVFRVAEVEGWRLWLAICDRDHHEEFMPHIREGVMLLDEGHSRLVYQYLGLPGIKDRHWIIRTRTNGPLWTASGETAWESSWSLEPGAEEMIPTYVENGDIEKIDAKQAEDAIVTPINDGCWLLVDLPDDRCFIAYQDLSDIGGKVPPWVVNELGPGGLTKLVIKVEERAKSIEQFFSTERPPPKAPDGTDIEQLRID